MLTTLGMYIPSNGLSPPNSTTLTFIAPALFSKANWRYAAKTPLTSETEATYTNFALYEYYTLIFI